MMNMFDEARSMKGMIEMLGATQSELAKRLGVSQSYVANKIRLLKLSAECEKKILEGGLSERHARAVLRLDENEERLSALTKISKENLTVAQSEALVDFLHNGKAPARIGSTERGLAKDKFFDTVHQSVEALVSLGISATKSLSYYGKKTYLTVCIDEG